MTDEISFLIVSPDYEDITAAAVESMVGTETLLNGRPVRVVAAHRDRPGAIRVTVCGVPDDVMELVRRGSIGGVSFG